MVRFAVVGIGNMGSVHARKLFDKAVEGAELAAVCDISKERLDSAENAPVSYKYKDGSTAFWCAVQVRNHRYPIETLEYLNSDGEFVQLPRRNFNYFEAQSGLGEGPFTFRITDIYGQVVIDEDIPFTPDEIQEGHVQFPE